MSPTANRLTERADRPYSHGSAGSPLVSFRDFWLGNAKRRGAEGTPKPLGTRQAELLVDSKTPPSSPQQTFFITASHLRRLGVFLAAPHRAYSVDSAVTPCFDDTAFICLREFFCWPPWLTGSGLLVAGGVRRERRLGKDETSNHSQPICSARRLSCQYPGHPASGV